MWMYCFEIHLCILAINLRSFNKYAHYFLNSWYFLNFVISKENITFWTSVYLYPHNSCILPRNCTLLWHECGPGSMYKWHACCWLNNCSYSLTLCSICRWLLAEFLCEDNPTSPQCTKLNLSTYELVSVPAFPSFGMSRLSSECQHSVLNVRTSLFGIFDYFDLFGL